MWKNNLGYLKTFHLGDVGTLEKSRLLRVLLFFFFFFLAAPTAHGSSWARDWTHATAVTWAAAMTRLDHQSVASQGNSQASYIFCSIIHDLLNAGNEVDNYEFTWPNPWRSCLWACCGEYTAGKSSLAFKKLMIYFQHIGGNEDNCPKPWNMM